ncbi:MAG: hypothetical protein IBX64_01415 [Actinobacteria bacterium]|nr:hypothetical protein [Actinomycetota bacterium]
MAEAKRKPEERRPPLREVKPGEEERRERLEEARPPTSGLAMAGLALAVISVFLPVIIAVIAAFTGAALGGVALSQIRRGERSGSGLAWGAIIIGAIVGILALIFLAQVLTGTAGSSSSLFNL